VTERAPRAEAQAADTNVATALHQRAHRWQPAFQATGMSAFVALVVTAINTGIDAQLVARWLHAWRLALPAAIVAAYLFRPAAWWIALRLARWSRRART